MENQNNEMKLNESAIAFLRESAKWSMFLAIIGFIGIAVPHIARILFKTSDHKILIPGTILTGGAVMLASDIISQLPGSESVLPINAVTSLIGIPVVIWVILRNRKYSGLF